ncbi:MAG: N-acetyltransferase [Xanthobacteraceae bacterium]|nr:N-acetyltransferase [Xanthobacteraceae bacterium]QYK44458.1 MAG: N-acetyltransferase [Xanthobacteraceae bacterium]HMN51492.1 N-acetyltransferase [Xanthobacteraceae bacterium]
MADLSLNIAPEQPEDDAAIERLSERTFGPGRFARSAYRLREGAEHRRDLSYTARIGTLLVGSVRLTPIRIGKANALLLGPLTVEPPFRSRGVGRALMEASMKAARDAGAKLVFLVGDEPYYGRIGFKKVEKGRVKMPGPVDPERVLIAELTPGAFDGVEGAVRPFYED